MQDTQNLFALDTAQKYYLLHFCSKYRKEWGKTLKVKIALKFVSLGYIIWAVL